MKDELFTRRFFALWLFGFVAFFSVFQLLPVIPFRIQELGGTKAEAGWFLGVYTYASAFAAPIMGSIADRIGRRRLLVIASLLFILFSLIYGVVRFLPLLLVIAAAHGALWSGLSASSGAIMSEFIPESRRVQGLAYWGLSSTLAVGIAPAVGLWIFKHGGWLLVCVEMAVLSIIMAIGAARIPAPPPAPHGSPFVLREAWDWRVIAAALSFSVMSFGQGGATSYVAMFSRERGIHPDSLYFSAFSLTIILIRVFGAHLGDRLDARAILYPAFLTVPASFFVLSIADSPALVVLSAILFGFGLGAGYPAFATFILGVTESRNRARTFGSILWAFDIGMGTGSLLVGILGERFGLGRAFAVAGIVSCLASPIFALASRRLRKAAPSPLLPSHARGEGVPRSGTDEG